MMNAVCNGMGYAGVSKGDLYIVVNCQTFEAILVQSNFDRSNLFVGPGNFPIHLMLKYTQGSNSDGSNSRTQSTVRRAIFHVKTL